MKFDQSDVIVIENRMVEKISFFLFGHSVFLLRKK